MTFSKETLDLFTQLLNGVQISGGDPNFDEAVCVVGQARKELAQAVNESEGN